MSRSRISAMSSQSFRGESSLSAIDSPRSHSLRDTLNKESDRKSLSFEGSSSASHFNDDEFRNLDVIVTSLGSHSVNWIKKRRSLGSHAKVAMTFQSERRLRKIFNGFDFDKSGSVSLDEFHHALDFCRQSKSFHRLSEKLDDLEKTFVAMDTDGDATVDFHEFCIGMTGRAKGPFDGLSDWDINRLIEMFLTYAEMSKRSKTIQSIESAPADAEDFDCVQYFKSLYAGKKAPEKKEKSMKKSKEDELRESMNSDFVDPDTLAVQRQLAEEKKFLKTMVYRVPERSNSLRSGPHRSKLTSSSFVPTTDMTTRRLMDTRLRASTEAYDAMRGIK